jgi:hypothetical protein
MRMHAATRIALLFSCLPLMGQGPADDGRWHAGAYSYSDEMGGFRILSVSGTGTRDDPVSIVQELDSATPIVLTIRAERPTKMLGAGPEFASGMIYMRIAAVNGSGVPWIAYEFELQETVGEPSTFGDGLSFDQRRREGSGELGSDSFGHYSRDYEPYDRVRFTEGAIDPRAQGMFRLFITDFTPDPIFYLRQDPQAPYS